MDGPNVQSTTYKRCYFPGPIFGPYSFIDIPHGREEFGGGGRSPRNRAEVTVISWILKNLCRGMPTYNFSRLCPLFSENTMNVKALDSSMNI